MGEYPLNFHSGSFRTFFYKSKAAFIRTDSDAAHAGIHFYMYFDRPAACLACLSHFFQHILPEYCGPDFFPGHLLVAIWKSVAKHQHRLAYSASLKNQGLFHGSNGKTVKERHILDFMGNRNRAVAIAIRFHYSHNLGIFPDIIFHLYHIILHCIQIYSCPYPVIVFHNSAPSAYYSASL